MLKMTKTFFIFISLGLAGFVNAQRLFPNRVVVVTKPTFKEYGGLGLDDVTIATPPLKNQF